MLCLCGHSNVERPFCVSSHDSELSHFVCGKTCVGLLSVKLSFTAGDDVIIIQPSASAATDISGKVVTSSSKVLAYCCSALLDLSVTT